MDPVTILGAISGAVQLLDAAIKVSSHTYRAISAVNHATVDILALRTRIEEVEPLMRELQIYAAEALQSPSTINLQHTVLSSIVRIAQKFAEDMAILRKALPSDPSPTLGGKIEFIRNKKSLREIDERLEQRQASATMALSILGRIEGGRLRNDVLSIRDGIARFSSEQMTLSRNLSELYDDHTTRSNSLESNVLAAIHELKDRVEHGTVAANNSYEMLNEVRSQAFTFRTNLHGGLDRNSATQFASQEVHGCPASQAESMTVSIERDGIAESPDLLGRIIRAELRQQLEPVLHQLQGTEQTVDRIALMVSREAHALALAKNTVSNGADDFPGYGGHPAWASNQDNSWKTQTPGIEVSHWQMVYQNPKSRDAILSQLWHVIDIKIGEVKIETTTYRAKITNTHTNTKCFRLKITFIPRAWIFLRGFSAMYSSGPNGHGYYDICPSILTFRIIPNDSPIWSPFEDDDVPGLKKLLNEGHLTLRDRCISGFTLLHHAVARNAGAITRYLLQDMEYWEQLIGQGLFSIGAFWTTAFVKIETISRTPQLLDTLKECTESYYFDLLSGSIWDRLFVEGFKPRFLNFGEALKYSQLYLQFGAIIHAFEWGGNGDMDKNKFLLRIYLTTGGNPNEMRRESGIPPLLKALEVLGKYTSRGSNPDTRLLEMLISSGADIYYMVPLDDGAFAWTLQDGAKVLEVDDLWGKALATCGLNVEAVHAEMKRRKIEYRLLSGATRTGVDVEFLVHHIRSSDIRRRKCRKVVDDDT